MAQKVDEIISGIIVNSLKDGIAPWRKPWINVHGESLYLNAQGKPYSFLNSLLLMAQGKPAGEFYTFNKITEKGGKVKKGSKSAYVTFYKPNIKEIIIPAEESEDGKEHKIYKKSFVLRYYKVFSIHDCDGIEPKYTQTENAPISNLQPIEAAERILKAYIKGEGAPNFYNDGSDNATYNPATDTICVPALSQYKHAPDCYSTWFHECIHSTGNKSRLNRFTENEKFGNVDYSREELVAEIGAAALNFICGIEESDSSYRNSIAYLQGWASHLADKPNEFIVAAGRAEKAVNWVLGNRAQAQENKPSELTDVA